MGAGHGEVMGRQWVLVMQRSWEPTMGTHHGEVIGARDGEIMGAGGGKVMGDGSGEVMGKQKPQQLPASLSTKRHPGWRNLFLLSEVTQGPPTQPTFILELKNSLHRYLNPPGL